MRNLVGDDVYCAAFEVNNSKAIIFADAVLGNKKWFETRRTLRYSGRRIESQSKSLLDKCYRPLRIRRKKNRPAAMNKTNPIQI